MPAARLDESRTGPCPVPAGVARVLVFGGTFDPVTIAHTRLAECAAEVVGAGWTLFIPAKRNPLKPEGPRATDADRVEMLRLALAGRERVGVCTLEIEREGASYTIETVRELRRRLGAGVTLRLLIGADQAVSFHRWREAGALLEEAEPVVALRLPVRTREDLRAAMVGEWGESGAEEWAGRVVEAPLLDVAATEVREAIEREGVGSETVRGAIGASIAAYIRDRGMYEGSR